MLLHSIFLFVIIILMIVPISSNKMMIFAQAKDTSNSFSYPILISTRGPL